MRFVTGNAAIYEKALSKYEADIYIKGRTKIEKSNFLIRFAHHILPVNRKNKDMLFEMISHSQYNAPNIFRHDIKAINGNSIPNQKKQQEVLNFLNINVYSSTFYKDELLTPFGKEAFSYYKFKLLETKERNGLNIFKIGFTPKEPSQKLVSGILYIKDQQWLIDRVEMNGRYSFADFTLNMAFSKDEEQYILPESADLTLKVSLLGNDIETTYHSNSNYKKIEWDEAFLVGRKKRSLDLTNYYSVANKEIPIISDSSYWNKYRDIPLSSEENELYNHIATTTSNDSTRSAKYLELTEDLTGSINLDIRSTQFRYSGLINPSQLGYSKMNGITYKQKIRLNKTFKNESQLRFRPELGFIFKRKEIFLKLAGEYEYLPERLGYLSLSVGNTYQSYSSAFMKEIKEQVKDSTFNFDNLDLPYFKTYFADFRHNIEVFHGFQAAVGLSYFHRTPSEKKTILTEGEDVNDLVNKDYNDFTPVASLTYTPRQYYRMVGKKKEYMYSYYPTMTVEVARAIPGILNSNGDYCRVEANVQQAIPLGLCRELSYNISGGLYTDQKSIYFADFRFFAQNYFPDRWSEEMGGKFHLLKREWYNASDKYIQGHFMYESPFILLHLFKKGISKYVMSERFYFGHLWTPVLNNYTEIGYGIGNHIFNVAGFVSFKGKEYQRFGLRFAFELF